MYTILPLLLLIGCNTIQTGIRIDAPVSVVWQHLKAVNEYPQWNPFIRKLEGDWKTGESLSVQIQPIGSSEMEFSPVVLRVKENELLEWRGKLAGIPGLFTGQHKFELEDLDGKATNFKQSEEFSGILVPLFDLRPTLQGFNAMNLALKKQTENAWRELE